MHFGLRIARGEQLRLDDRLLPAHDRTVQRRPRHHQAFDFRRDLQVGLLQDRAKGCEPVAGGGGDAQGPADRREIPQYAVRHGRRSEKARPVIQRGVKPRVQRGSGLKGPGQDQDYGSPSRVRKTAPAPWPTEIPAERRIPRRWRGSCDDCVPSRSRRSRGRARTGY